MGASDEMKRNRTGRKEHFHRKKKKGQPASTQRSFRVRILAQADQTGTPLQAEEGVVLKNYLEGMAGPGLGRRLARDQEDGTTHGLKGCALTRAIK